MSWKLQSIYRGRRLPDPHRPGAGLDAAGPTTVQRFDDAAAHREAGLISLDWPTIDTGGDWREPVAGVEISPAPSLKIRNHSPDGFNWGYSGSGPAQLALGLVLDFTDSPRLAELVYQDFKADFVAAWGDGWVMPGNILAAWLVGHLVELLDAGRLTGPELAELTADCGPIDRVSASVLAAAVDARHPGAKAAVMRGVSLRGEGRA